MCSYCCSLLHLGLTSYVIFWAISFSTDFICLVFLLVFLPESMPDTLRKPLDGSDLIPIKYYWHSIKIVAKYPLLVGVRALEPSHLISWFQKLLTDHCIYFSIHFGA